MDRMDLDDRDRKIIGLFERDPEISQADVAAQVGLSQPAIGARIGKLRQSGALSSTIGVDLRKAGLSLAKVDLTARDSNVIIDRFRQCPYFVNAMIVSGRENLSMYFAAEDISTLEALVDRHLRSNPDVSNVDFGLVVSQVQNPATPVKIGFEKGEASPCGFDCPTCQYYLNNRCLGCPMTKHYKGSFW